MKALSITLAVVMLALIACNESQRGNDSNGNESQDEAAAATTTDKLQEEMQRDAEFIYEGVSSYYGNVKLAELANQRSRNENVKALAQKMVTNQIAALNDLKTLAQEKAISIPVEEDGDLDRKIENLAANSAEEFDRAWTNEMLNRVEHIIGKFDNRLKATEDKALKNYIERTLPVLEQHEGQLESMKEELNENA